MLVTLIALSMLLTSFLGTIVVLYSVSGRAQESADSLSTTR
jgi:hypothetical protein